MASRSRIPALVIVLALTPPAHAQDKLAYLIPTLFGPNGLIVNSEARLPTGETHSAHFNSSFQTNFSPFNSALASRLASVPLPAPASGFTYTFDPALGVFNRSTRSFGPLVADRAETIGKKRASLGFAYQYFSFDSIDGLDLDNIPIVFTHDNPVRGTGRDDVITATNKISAQMAQFTAYLSYGISDRVDVSVALPLVSVDLAVSSRATIQRIGTTNDAIHFFYEPTGDHYGDHADFLKVGHATGIGDVALRMKASVWHRPNLGVAVGVESRLPTGDEKDLLGAGAFAVKPFLVVSSSHGGFSPHLNAAYQWNGKSLLGGNVLSGVKEDLPDEAVLALGADMGVGQKLTIAFDAVFRRVINGEQVFSDTFTALNNTSKFPVVSFSKGSYNVVDGAIGLKANPGGGLLVNLNVTFKLNDSGLRDRVTPLLGIEYSF
jgi:Putative MetA-pathway of phenol degradation